MRISISQLRRIIKEEVSRTRRRRGIYEAPLRPARGQRLSMGAGDFDDTSLYDADRADERHETRIDFMHGGVKHSKVVTHRTFGWSEDFWAYIDAVVEDAVREDDPEGLERPEIIEVYGRGKNGQWVPIADLMGSDR